MGIKGTEVIERAYGTWGLDRSKFSDRLEPALIEITHQAHCAVSITFVRYDYGLLIQANVIGCEDRLSVRE